MPEIGKTTVIPRVAEQLKIRENGDRRGFGLVGFDRTKRPELVLG